LGHVRSTERGEQGKISTPHKGLPLNGEVGAARTSVNVQEPPGNGKKSFLGRDSGDSGIGAFPVRRAVEVWSGKKTWVEEQTREGQGLRL